MTTEIKFQSGILRVLGSTVPFIVKHSCYDDCVSPIYNAKWSCHVILQQQIFVSPGN